MSGPFSKLPKPQGKNTVTPVARVADQKTHSYSNWLKENETATKNYKPPVTRVAPATNATQNTNDGLQKNPCENNSVTGATAATQIFILGGHVQDWLDEFKERLAICLIDGNMEITEAEAIALAELRQKVEPGLYHIQIDAEDLIALIAKAGMAL